MCCRCILGRVFRRRVESSANLLDTRHHCRNLKKEREKRIYVEESCRILFLLSLPYMHIMCYSPPWHNPSGKPSPPLLPIYSSSTAHDFVTTRNKATIHCSFICCCCCCCCCCLILIKTILPELWLLFGGLQFLASFTFWLFSLIIVWTQEQKTQKQNVAFVRARRLLVKDKTASLFRLTVSKPNTIVL